MAFLGIPNTDVKRDRATTKFLVARADALFDIDHRQELVDKSQSEFLGGGRAVVRIAGVGSTAPRSP